jgi:hypothetical protein
VQSSDEIKTLSLERAVAFLVSFLGEDVAATELHSFLVRLSCPVKIILYPLL